MRAITACLFVACITSFSFSEAQPPQTINLQGGLADLEGGPITGTHLFQVDFFDAAVGGNQIGLATGTVEFSAAGRYSIAVVPSTEVIAANEAYYQLAIDTADDGLDPGDTFPNRVQIHSVPFALQAANARLLGGSQASEFLTTDAGTGQFLRKDVSDEFSGSKLTVVGELNVGQEGISSFDVNIFGASPGARLYWDESQNALRAGRVTGTQWDSGNVGLDSVAMGFNTTASGDYTAAIGFGSTASGKYGIAMGYKSQASGNYSAALGYEVVASGVVSTAIGNLTLATGRHSTAFGSITEASGFASTAMGRDTIASGTTSTAMGHETTASGSASTAMGYQTTASGYDSTAMGYQTTASGSSSTAMGYQTTASRIASTAMGRLTSASGIFSTAMGDRTTASGRYALATGRLSKATAISSTAMGDETTASGNYSTALGRQTVASGDFAMAMGRGIEAKGNNTVAIALNNQSGTTILENNTMAVMGGQVGIGTVKPSHLLHVNGSARSTQAAWDTSSDQRVKTNITELSGSLDRVLQLRPVRFNWSKEFRIANPSLSTGDISFLAQEVETVFPEMVREVREEVGDETVEDFRVMNSGILIPVLVKAIQEQNEVIRNQQNQIEGMREEFDRLREIVDSK